MSDLIRFDVSLAQDKLLMDDCFRKQPANTGTWVPSTPCHGGLQCSALISALSQPPPLPTLPKERQW